MIRRSDCSVNRCDIQMDPMYKLSTRWYNHGNAWARADSSLCSFTINCSGSDRVYMRLLELTSDSLFPPRGSEKWGFNSSTSRRSSIGNGVTFRDDVESRNVAVVVEGRAESEMGILSTRSRCNRRSMLFRWFILKGYRPNEEGQGCSCNRPSVDLGWWLDPRRLQVSVIPQQGI